MVPNAFRAELLAFYVGNQQNTGGFSTKGQGLCKKGQKEKNFVFSTIIC